jgi:hypothetical protein
MQAAVQLAIHVIVQHVKILARDHKLMPAFVQIAVHEMPAWYLIPYKCA